MAVDPIVAASIAQQYTRSAIPLKRLGWGVSGFVYLSPNGRTALKVHRHEESYVREVEVYHRLRTLRLRTLHGLNIPKLHASRSELLLIEMSFVTPPFLLDFAGVRFDEPDFVTDRREEWETGIAQHFGGNAWFAHLVYHELAKLDLYYTDFRPTNLNLEGHSDAAVSQSSNDDF